MEKSKKVITLSASLAPALARTDGEWESGHGGNRTDLGNLVGKVGVDIVWGDPATLPLAPPPGHPSRVPRSTDRHAARGPGRPAGRTPAQLLAKA